MTCIDTVHKSPYFLRTHLVFLLLLRRRKYTPQKSLKQLSFAFVSTTQTCFLVTVQNYSFFDELIRSCLANKPPSKCNVYFCKYLNGCVRKKKQFFFLFSYQMQSTRFTNYRKQRKNNLTRRELTSGSTHMQFIPTLTPQARDGETLLRNIHDKLLTVHNGDQL